MWHSIEVKDLRRWSEEDSRLWEGPRLWFTVVVFLINFRDSSIFKHSISLPFNLTERVSGSELEEKSLILLPRGLSQGDTPLLPRRPVLWFVEFSQVLRQGFEGMRISWQEEILYRR